MRRLRRVISMVLFLAVFLINTQSVFAAGESMSWKTIDVKNKVNTINGSIDLKEYEIKDSEIIGFDILKNGKRDKVYYYLEGTKIKFVSELTLNTNYTLRVITSSNKYELKFKSGDLQDIKETGERIIVKIPAMPEKGFNWAYYLAIPSNAYKQENKDHKRYIMVDTTNTTEHNLEGFERWVEDTLTNRSQSSVSVAEKLWTPMLMPAFPKSNVNYSYENEHNTFYEHAFDRDIATLHKKLEDLSLRKILEENFNSKGYDVNKFARQDEQLVAMFVHAAEYLNKYNHGVETDKMFLNGYSASGTFTDRLSALQPEKIKAVASGGTLDDMILPLAKHNGENLIFPIGVSDYKNITGKEFNLSSHNSMARLIYMGKDDDNNTVPYSDCYGDKERNIITKLWGVPVLPRAEALIELYGKSGGKGIFILDKDIGHGSSRDMNDYVLEFFKANRKPGTNAYPTPKNPQQLQYKLFK